MTSMTARDWHQITENILRWIQQQIEKASAKGLVLGLSGGVDSGVTAALSKRASDSTLALIMPMHEKSDTEDALLVAEQLNLETRTIDIGPVLNSILKTLDIEDPNWENMCIANLQPRVRMIILYYHANKHHYLVTGTSNKTELSIGYFTKHGDGAADILPLGSLLKTEVIELAEHLNIPKQIIEKTPSAGLWSGQADEEEIGLTYQQIDTYLRTGEAPPEIKQRMEQMIRESAHKRNLPPIPDV